MVAVTCIITQLNYLNMVSNLFYIGKDTYDNYITHFLLFSEEFQDSLFLP